MDTLICGGGLVSKMLYMTLGTFRRPRYPLHPQNKTSNNQRLRSAGGQRSKVETIMLLRCDLRGTFQAIDGQNTRDQSTSDRRFKRA